MGVNRRAFLASAGALTGTALAGCSEVNIDEPLRFESTPAYISDSVLEETGYEERDRDEIRIQRSFDVGGDDRTVTVTNQLVTYEQSVTTEVSVPEELSNSVFATVTTPSIELLGQELNPVAEMSNEELIEEAGDQFGRIENIEISGEAEITILGEATTRTQFSAETQLADANVDVYLHVNNPVKRDEEFVSGVGVHPQRLPAEEAAIRKMFGGIESGG